MTDADTFIREHYPESVPLTDGRHVAICTGCSRAVGDYVEWPCGDVWSALDTLARSADLLSEAERRGAEKGWQRGFEAGQADEFDAREGHERDDPYRSRDGQ